MKTLFILGHNPELSRAEVFSYLEKQGIDFSYEQEGDNLIINCEDLKINVQELGGVKAVGRVLFSGNYKEILEFIRKKEIYFGKETNFTYSIYGTTEILNAVKSKLKEEKLKAKYSTKLDSEVGWFYIGKNFGIIEQVYSSKEDEKRDMKKPVRRSQLAISPRLARILVNLSQVKQQKILVDCFCGIGVILQEALLLGINCIGVDIDKKAIFNCQRNLKWLAENYQSKAGYKLLAGDSRKIRLERVNGIACEPELGRLLKKIPGKEEAGIIIKRFNGLIISALNNLKYALKYGGKIVFTSPLIKTIDGNLGIDIDYICKKTGLKMHKLKDINFPITETRESKIVGREIWVLEG